MEIVTNKIITMESILKSIETLKIELSKKRKTEALTKNNQKNVNAFVKHNLNYDMLVNTADCIRDFSKDIKRVTKVEQQQEAAYNKASNYWGDLPISEKRNLMKNHDYLSIKDY
jgi:hypothetical protein